MIKTGDTKIIQILDIEVIVCLRNSYFSPILNKRNKILAKICKLCIYMKKSYYWAIRENGCVTSS